MNPTSAVHSRPRRRSRLTVVAATTVLVAGSAILAGAPSSGAAPPSAPGASPQWAKFVDELPIPPTIAAPGAVLCEVSGTHKYHSAAPETDTFGYVPANADGTCPTGGEAYLGPTLEAQRGVPARVVVKHNLRGNPLADKVDFRLHGTENPSFNWNRPPTATHKHGGHVAPRNDGGPTDLFGPGTGRMSWVFNYGNDQEATTLWYHDHAQGITRLNVVNGLAGYYLLRDTSDTGRAGNPAGLPSGAYEVPLVLQDRRFDADGELVYEDGPWTDTPDPLTGETGPWTPEYFGDVATVNGTAFPKHTVERGVYRYRMLNGSNARFYRMRLQGSGAKMYQVGTDGGLLNAPVRLNVLTLAPGERADVLLDFRGVPRGRSITLTNDAPVPFPNGPRAGKLGGVPIPSIMQFQVAGAAVSGSVPTQLRGGPGQNPAIAPAASYAAQVEATGGENRRIFLNEILDPATGAPVEALLNNLPFHISQAQQETPRNNTVETWTFINTTGDTHPIHLHLAQFQVLTRQKISSAKYLDAVNAALAPSLPPACAGLPNPCAAELGPYGDEVPELTGFTINGPSPIAANERGWKDTVMVNPGEAVSIVVAFGGTQLADRIDLPLPYTKTYTGQYVLHCHILEHEDNDMMLPYTVLPS